MSEQPLLKTWREEAAKVLLEFTSVSAPPSDVLEKVVDWIGEVFESDEIKERDILKIYKIIHLNPHTPKNRVQAFSTYLMKQYVIYKQYLDLVGVMQQTAQNQLNQYE